MNNSVKYRAYLVIVTANDCDPCKMFKDSKSEIDINTQGVEIPISTLDKVVKNLKKIPDLSIIHIKVPSLRSDINFLDESHPYLKYRIQAFPTIMMVNNWNDKNTPLQGVMFNGQLSASSKNEKAGSISFDSSNPKYESRNSDNLLNWVNTQLTISPLFEHKSSTLLSNNYEKLSTNNQPSYGRTEDFNYNDQNNFNKSPNSSNPSLNQSHKQSFSKENNTPSIKYRPLKFGTPFYNEDSTRGW